MTSTQLIIFDCDGVLIDSEIVVCRLVSEELSRLGYGMNTKEVIRRFAGRPEREMVADIEADWGQKIPAEFFARVKERTEAAYASELCAVPGVAEALDNLRVPLCVASSSYPEKLRLGLHSVDLLERFEPHVISAYVVAHGKPAPDVFIYTAGWMRTPVAHCLVIEDSTHGVHAARSAGMRVFGFTGGQHCGPDHREYLMQAGAELVFDNFRHLADLVAAEV
ncbi:HAD family hydrolase [Cyanobacteria bacterium FACHB-DQ100]|nr:HAD family hydrolase [Cyanobacteria bacterium FACHB-DQ100]